MLETLRLWLPRGNTLPYDLWQRRHRGIVVLLWVHAVIIPIFGVLRGVGPLHVLAESLVVPAAAAYASWSGASRRMRTLVASTALLSASAILVHFSGGVIEVHFHFFVMVAVVSLYQDWLPFLAAVGYVFVHHAVLGSIDPRSVFNHPAAVNHPWRWAAIHAMFIAGISVACLVAWRLNEDSLEQQRSAEERLRQETQVVETLHHVGRSLASELDLHTVLQRVTDASRELTAAQFGAFFYNQVDEAGEAYQLYTLSGVPEESFAGFPMPRATGIFAPTFRGEGVVRYADVTTEPAFGNNPPFNGMPEGHLPVRSYLAVPVSAHDGEVYGGLFFGHSEVGKFTEIDERIVVGIAAHATVAIENARLYESERKARAASEAAGRRLVILAQAGQVLAASVDVEATLAELVRLVTPEISDSCAVYLPTDGGRLTPVAARASYDAPAEFGGDTVARDHPAHPVAQVVRSGVSQFLREIPTELVDAALDDRSVRTFVRRAQPTSAIIVPLTVQHDVIGAFALGTVSSSGRRLTEADLELAEELARRAAVAIQHARLYVAQRDVAETLQHSLLPDKLPNVPGLDTAARYVPGGPGSEIGGDWYDVLSFGDGTLGLAMGDVVGRGTPAASLMGQLRNALRAYALDTREPTKVMKQLNALIEELGPPGAMATLVYGVYDLDTCTLTLANAGHPPPVLLGDGRITFIDSGLGPPLGAVGTPEFVEATVSLPPGSTLLMYTDGLVEDRAMPLAVGLDRLLGLIAEAPMDAEGLVDHVMAAALADRGGGDDAALLALRVCPAEREVRLTLPRRPDVIRALRTTLRRQLRRVGASGQEEFEILVAAGEACANAIQHAGPTSETFDFEAIVDDDVCITVRDRGRWRDQRPSDGGRGFTIMEQFMDEVEVDRSPAGTQVLLRRALAARSKGGRA